MIRCRPVIVAAAALWIACGTEPEPGDTVRVFWVRVHQADLQAAARLTVEQDPEALRGVPMLADSVEVELVETLENERSALVETRLVPVDGSTPLQFYTHLVATESGWRIELEPTRESLRRARLEAAFASLEGSVREGIEAVEDALGEGARIAAEALQDALDDLERDLPPSP